MLKHKVARHGHVNKSHNNNNKKNASIKKKSVNTIKHKPHNNKQQTNSFSTAANKVHRKFKHSINTRQFTTTNTDQQDQQSNDNNNSTYDLPLQQKLVWMHNKLRNPILQGFHFYLTQYQAIPPPAIDDVSLKSIESAEDVIFKGLVAHKLLIKKTEEPTIQPPIDNENDPQVQSIQHIITSCNALDILPQDWDVNYKIGFVPNNRRFIPSQFETDLTDQQYFAKERVHNIVDVFQMCLNISGYADLPGSFIPFYKKKQQKKKNNGDEKDYQIDDEITNLIDVNSAMLTDFVGKIRVPFGEDDKTDFSNISLKKYNPNDSTQQQIQIELAQINAVLQATQDNAVYDDIGRRFARNDVLQAYITAHGTEFKDVKVYRSMLLQQAAQTMLEADFLATPNAVAYTSTVAEDPISIAIAKKRQELGLPEPEVKGTAAATPTNTNISPQHNKAMEEYSQNLYDTLQRALPPETFPQIDGEMPHPPQHFFKNQDKNKHQIITPHDDDFNEDIMTYKQATLRTFTTPAQFREQILMNFRHEILMFYNAAFNPVIQGLRNNKDFDLNTPINGSGDIPINILKDLLFDLFAQNKMDNEFKQKYTQQQIGIQRAKAQQEQLEQRKVEPITDPQLAKVQPIITKTSEELQIMINDFEAQQIDFKHVLTQRYPAFAQRCYELVKHDADENAQGVIQDDKKKQMAQMIQALVENAYQEEQEQLAAADAEEQEKQKDNQTTLANNDTTNNTDQK